jgi:hypothetical protein
MSECVCVCVLFVYSTLSTVQYTPPVCYEREILSTAVYMYRKCAPYNLNRVVAWTARPEIGVKVMRQIKSRRAEETEKEQKTELAKHTL